MRRIDEGMIMLTCALGEDVLPLMPTEYDLLTSLLLRAPCTDADSELTESFLRNYNYCESEARRIVSLISRDDTLHRYLSKPDVTVITRLNHEEYPSRLRRLFPAHRPTVLFCRGDISLLKTRCISLVGSRYIEQRNRTFAEKIGYLAAKEGYTLVSGGAIGSDTAAQEACLAAGGKVVCFVPDALQKYPVRKNILYCSDDGWDCRFTAQRALRRNRYIHALGEKVFVAACTHCKGGTWSGTNYNLNHGLSEVILLRDDSEGIRNFIRRGLRVLDEAPDTLRRIMENELSIFD